MNRTNLKLLADWLIENAGYLVETKGFHMDYFRGFYDEDGDIMGKSIEQGSQLDTNSCGTIGCAIGWAPLSKIPELLPADSDYRGLGGGTLSFNSYSERVMGLSIEEGEWIFLFDDDWSEIDNTPKGAAIRILYLLANGIPYNDDGGVEISQEVEEGYMGWYNDQT